MQPSRILVVCVGNLCRSPVAERLLQARLDAVSPGAVEVRSAGTRATDGRAMDRLASEQIKRLGVSSVGFTATRLTPEMAAVDLVLTMTTQLRQDVLRVAPRAMKRTFTLSEFATLCSQPDVEGASLPELVTWASGRRSRATGAVDVIDPYGEPVQVHEQAADQVAELVGRIAPVVARVAIPVA